MPTFDPHKTTTQVRHGNRTLMNTGGLIVWTSAVVIALVALYVIFMRQSPPGL